MPFKFVLTLCVLAAMTVGCQKHDRDFKPAGTVNLSHRAANTALVQSYHLQAIDDAIIRQHTIYPYHFVVNSDQLNSLGRREAAVLAHHYQRYPGPLNVRRGTEPDGLYESRAASVRQFLIDRGVEPNAITIGDELPGGDGISSDQVVIVLERMQDSTLSGASAPEAGQTGRRESAPRAGMGADPGDDQ